MPKIVVSKGNTKIGKVMNISLPPGKSCVPGVNCYADGCYAKNAYRMYPNVRKAWDTNLDVFLNSPTDYFIQLGAEISKVRPLLFRWHVGGDIISQNYLNGVMAIAAVYSSTKFLIFTKRYDLDYSRTPANLNVIFSIWPGMALPKTIPSHIGLAYLMEDIRWDREGFYLRCPGNCIDCLHLCWTTVCTQIPVVFNRH